MQRTLRVLVRAAMMGAILLCFFAAAGQLAEHVPLWLAGLGFIGASALFVCEVRP